MFGRLLSGSPFNFSRFIDDPVERRVHEIVVDLSKPDALEVIDAHIEKHGDKILDSLLVITPAEAAKMGR